MRGRIKDKIEEIEGYLLELEEEVPDTKDNYLANRKTQLICERLFEIITEGFIDLAFIVIKERQMDMPVDDEGAFNKLASENLISQELAKKLQEARRM